VLAGLVRPWVSVHALARAEPALLDDLARRAVQAGQALGYERSSLAPVYWVIAAFLVALAGSAVVGAVNYLPSWRSVTSLADLGRAFPAAGSMVWISLGAMAGVLIVLWRLARRRR
jgi:hypothetical protein